MTRTSLPKRWFKPPHSVRLLGHSFEMKYESSIGLPNGATIVHTTFSTKQIKHTYYRKGNNQWKKIQVWR